jgi:hypothetical protein
MASTWVVGSEEEVEELPQAQRHETEKRIIKGSILNTQGSIEGL